MARREITWVAAGALVAFAFASLGDCRARARSAGGAGAGSALESGRQLRRCRPRRRASPASPGSAAPSRVGERRSRRRRCRTAAACQAQAQARSCDRPSGSTSDAARRPAAARPAVGAPHRVRPTTSRSSPSPHRTTKTANRPASITRRPSASPRIATLGDAPPPPVRVLLLRLEPGSALRPGRARPRPQDRHRSQITTTDSAVHTYSVRRALPAADSLQRSGARVVALRRHRLGARWDFPRMEVQVQDVPPLRCAQSRPHVAEPRFL